MTFNTTKAANLLILLSTAAFLTLAGVYLLTRKPPRALVRVVVAAKDLGVGTSIRESDIKIIELPEPLPDGAFTAKEEVLDRPLISNTLMGEPILEGHLAARGSGLGLAPTIPSGLRAIDLPIGQTAILPLPGAKVDVLLSDEGVASSEPATFKIALKNILVLGTGGSSTKEGHNQIAQHITLLLTPEDANILRVALSKKRIYLIVDETYSGTNGAAVAQLGVAAHAPEPTDAAFSGMEVLRQALKDRDEADIHRQAVEHERAALEAQRERLRDYTRIALSLLILPACMFVVLNKKTTPKQKTIAASIAGALIAFWFAAPK